MKSVELSCGGANGRHAKTRKSYHLAGFRVAPFRPKNTIIRHGTYQPPFRVRVKILILQLVISLEYNVCHLFGQTPFNPRSNSCTQNQTSLSKNDSCSMFGTSCFVCFLVCWLFVLFVCELFGQSVITK